MRSVSGWLGFSAAGLALPLALSALGAAQQSPVTAPPSAPSVRDPIAPLPQAALPGALPAQPLPPPPPPIWAVQDIQALQFYISGVGREGLNPADYDPTGLQAALASRDVVAASKAATDRFNLLSSALALGHVRGNNRIDWHVTDNDLDADRQRGALNAALAQHRIAEVLDSLLPTHPQYGALRTALETAAPTDKAKRDLIRLNMDRWRWLPRELGAKYIIVNVPSFHATLVENGATRWKQRAIAGAIKTPTPNLSVMATGVMLNPSWEVPKSIWPEVAGKPGYIAIKDKNGKFVRWSQPPGPNNALGQLKFVMYNPYNIYLHDTNARSRFNSQVRALSHGCVRTQNVLDLATELLGDDGGEWTPDKIAATLATKKSKQVNFVKPVPVYIVYFSAAALTDGNIVTYQDLYKRDSKVIMAMNNSKGTSTAALAADRATKP